MTTELDNLNAAVSSLEDKLNQAVALMKTLAVDLASTVAGANPTIDPKAVQAIADKLTADTVTLAAALASDAPGPIVIPPTPPAPPIVPPGSTIYTVPGAPAVLGQGNGSFQVSCVQNQITVFPFSMQGVTRSAYIKTTQNMGSMNVRKLVISDTPGGPPIDAHATNIDGQAQVNVVPIGSLNAGMYTPLKTDGTTYYANIYNIDQNGAQTCQNNDCNFLITFNGS
jgi:hypothetical protein